MEKMSLLCHQGTQPIETDRLCLRRFAAEDAGAVYRNWMSDGEVTKYLRMQQPADPESVREVLEKWGGRYDSPEYYQWGIALRQTDELIGSIGASVQSEADAIADVGYCLGRRFWNHGYATEALTAVLLYLIRKIGFNRVEACHSVQNPASGRVMQKAGMTFEGILRQGYRCRLGYQDSCIYSLLRDDLRSEIEPDPAPAKPDIRIRPATASDYESVASLENQVFTLHQQHRPDIFRPGYSLKESGYRRLLADETATVLVAAADETRIAAFCILKKIEHVNKVNRRYTSLFIDDFCVGDGFRHQGIGKALLGCIRELAAEMGARNIELNVWQFNRPAISFYQSMGFTPQRQRMEWKLPEPGGTDAL